MGMPPVALQLGRAEADAVRFDCDGDGVESSELPPGDGKGDSNSSSSNEAGTNEAALTHVDILDWGILRLGSLCDALPPVKAMGH